MLLEFHKAGPEDIGLISKLAESIWRAHYPGIISQEQIDFMLGKMYSEDSLLSQMQEGQNFSIVYADGRPEGYYSVSETEEGKYYVHKFYISADNHRRGIGSATFAHLLATDCPGYEEVRLQVNRKNFKAVNFYYKQGFTIDGAFDFDIGSGFSMDDFIMVLSTRKRGAAKQLD